MMACNELVNDSGETIGWICGGVSEVRQTDEEQWKWCYGCRYYTLHVWTVFVSSSPWYEPNAEWVCPDCGKDNTRMWR